MARNFGFGKSKLGKFAIAAAQHFAFQFIIQLGTPVLCQVTHIAIC